MQIYLNSANRLTGSSHDFTIAIPRITTHTYFTHCAVVSANIPKSFYMLEGSDYFLVDERAEVGGTLRQITFDAGNYSRRSFQIILATKLNTGAPAGLTYDVKYGNINDNITNGVDTGKYYYTVSGATADPSFMIASQYNLHELMGFVNNTQNDFASGVLVSTNILNFQNSETLFIRTDMINEAEDILCEIYYNGQPYLSNILYYNEQPTNNMKRLQYNDLLSNNVYRFYVSNDNGRIVNLNGIDILICVLLM